MHSAVELFSTFAGQAPDFAGWLKNAEINRDRSLRLQYLAGRGLNLYHADSIYSEMLGYANEPQGIFTGSPELTRALLQRIWQAWGRQ